jgi:hypothetical protein
VLRGRLEYFARRSAEAAGVSSLREIAAASMRAGVLTAQGKP